MNISKGPSLDKIELLALRRNGWSKPTTRSGAFPNVNWEARNMAMVRTLASWRLISGSSLLLVQSFLIREVFSGFFLATPESSKF